MAGYVSDAVIRRLPGYYRHLKELESEGVQQISSQGLGERMKLTASQIRQDINCFGGFGRQGYGYSVTELRRHIERILGVDKEHLMLLVGAGNIGRAISRSDSFSASGFRTVAIFDNDPQKIGMPVEDLVVKDVGELESFIAGNPIDIGVLAVSYESAQEMADRLCACGIKAIWNFVPIDLKLGPDIAVVNVHLNEGLEILSFKMLQNKRE